MTELVTSGRWRVTAGHEEEFVRAWAAFAEWASAQAGATTLRLGRDVLDPTSYVSFAPWTDVESARAWKGLPEFRERLARVVQHVDDFQSAELETVTTASDATSAIQLPAGSAAD